jgi:predicted DNA-binding transcriptional regulator AlpA
MTFEIITRWRIILMNTHPQGLLLTMKQLCSKLGLSKPTVYRLIRKNPAFPQPVNLGISTTNYFRRTELDLWIDNLSLNPKPKSQTVGNQIKTALKNKQTYVSQTVTT